MKKMLLPSIGILLNFTAIADENAIANEPTPADAPPVIKMPPTPRPLFLFGDDTPDKEKIIALVTAIQNDEIEALKNLLASNLDVNTKDTYYNETALIQAASMGKIEAVKLLIEVGADVNYKSVGHTLATGRPTGNYKTPLMMAALNGHVEIATLLLAAGADAQAEDWDKKTARDYATRNNIRGVNIPPPATPEETAREAALQAKCAEIISLLDAADKRQIEEKQP